MTDDPRSFASKALRKSSTARAADDSTDSADSTAAPVYDPQRIVACPVRVVIDERVELAAGEPISLHMLAEHAQLAGPRWQANPVGVIDPDDPSTWAHLLDVPRLPSRVSATFGASTQFARFGG